MLSSSVQFRNALLFFFFTYTYVNMYVCNKTYIMRNAPRVPVTTIINNETCQAKSLGYNTFISFVYVHYAVVYMHYAVERPITTISWTSFEGARQWRTGGDNYLCMILFFIYYHYYYFTGLLVYLRRVFLLLLIYIYFIIFFSVTARRQNMSSCSRFDGGFYTHTRTHTRARAYVLVYIYIYMRL